MTETAQTLAQQISQSADAISSRLSDDITNGRVDQEQANEILGNIAILRQQSDALYMAEIITAIQDQAEAQNKLEGLIEIANDKIKTIQNVAKAIDLAIDIIELAANAYASNAEGILTSIGKLKDDVDSLNA